MRVSTDGMPRALAHHEKRRRNMTRDTTSLNEKSEAELVRDARNGDRDAIAELFRRHYPHSIAVARRMLPAQEEFLDAVQSAYLSAFQKFPSFRAEASFKTWITRIVLNQCIMRLREPHRRRITLSLDEPVPGGTLPIIAMDSRTPEDLTLRAEIESAVADAVANLPTALHDVFTRCTVFGLPIRDTAEALGLTVQATKTRLFRARAQLRQELRASFAGGLTPATSRVAFRA
jgi:RNA polymerase sigma-70 factor (ECF subfamily)